MNRPRGSLAEMLQITGAPTLASLLLGCSQPAVVASRDHGRATASTPSADQATRPVDLFQQLGETVPEVFTGIELRPSGEVLIYRKPNAAFDATVRSRDTAGVVELRDAPRSLAEQERTLDAVHEYARRNNIPVFAGSTPNNGDPATVEVPAHELERSRRLLNERFGTEVHVEPGERPHFLVGP